MTYEIRHNDQFCSNEVYFDGKPSDAVREALKQLKMRWHSVKRCWYGYASEETIAAAITGTTPADYIPFGQYLDSFRVSYSGWIYFGSGANEYMHADKYFSLDRAEQERIREAAALYAYTKATTQESRSRHADHLTTETNAIIDRIDAIVTAYRYDCSNSMVDYFDTNFYYDIVLKPVAA